MSLYFRDEVQITPVSRDANFRNEVKGTSFTSKAHVEFDDRITYDSSGMPVRPARRVFISFNTSIKEGDYVKVTKQNGKTFIDRDLVVVSVQPISGLSDSHLEIIAGGFR